MMVGAKYPNADNQLCTPDDTPGKDAWVKPVAGRLRWAYRHALTGPETRRCCQKTRKETHRSASSS